MKTVSTNRLRSQDSRRGAAAVGCLLKILATGLVGVLILGGLGYMTFFSTSHHETPSSMFPMYGDLTPSTATDITLYAAGLDHTAEYTVSEEALKSFVEGEFNAGTYGPNAVDQESFERKYSSAGLVDWEWHEGLVEYDMYRSRGTTHLVLYDPRTGRTYQASAHW